MKCCKYFYRRASDAEACCTKNILCPYKGILEACPDYEPKEIQEIIQPKFKSKTNWEQVRIQAAIAAMQGMCCQNMNYAYAIYANRAVGIADALVEELKKEK